MKRPFILIILDGWGIGDRGESNPIYVANPSNIAYLKANFPAGALQASGVSAGLPWNEEGNSEVGHLNIGAGKIIYQHYPRITLAIRDKSFFKNEVLKKVFEHAKKNNSDLNLVGLLGSGIVHSSLEHLKALLEFAKNKGVSKINLHIMSDGRDSPPNSFLTLLPQIPKELVASVSGRFYAMDRDNHWERTQAVYDAITGNGPETNDIEGRVKSTYDKNLNDEYVEPTLIGPLKRPIKDGDALIFFNFREDRMRQMVSPFVLKNFDKFPVKTFDNLYIASMTQYDDSFTIPVAFKPEEVLNPLGKVLAENDKSQLRIAETQKYPYVTYFFNGLREEPFPKEYRVLIPSRALLRQEKHPEMMAEEITNRLVEAIEERVFDFILVNYANPDTIAHTGNYDACVETVKIIDIQLGKVIQACVRTNAILMITSDHGNIERVFNPTTGETETQHDPSPVPVYLVAKEFERRKEQAEIDRADKKVVGTLADVAPTILEIMRLPKPKDMTGQSFLNSINSRYQA